MDINAAAKEYGNGVITSLKKNRRILIMMLLFAAGMIIGAVSLKRADSYLSGAFSDMFSVYIRSKSSQSLGMNFINSLAVNAAFMLAVFVFGLCAVGLPLICILPIIRGVGIGILSGYLYSNFALRGLGYCVLVIYPGLIPAIFALLLACSAGINSSYEMLLSLSSAKAQRGEGSIKIYCMRFLIICILIVLAAVIDAAASRLFCRLFSFYFSSESDSDFLRLILTLLSGLESTALRNCSSTT